MAKIGSATIRQTIGTRRLDCSFGKPRSAYFFEGVETVMIKNPSASLVAAIIFTLSILPCCAPVDLQTKDDGPGAEDGSGGSDPDPIADGCHANGDFCGCPVDTLSPVVTDIFVHNKARVAAGDDLIAFGTGSLSGVQYIIPSADDSDARDIPDGHLFGSRNFAVTGTKIILIDPALQITVFDSMTQSMETIAADQVCTVSSSTDIHAVGHMQADRGYVALRTDHDMGSSFKVIDVNGVRPAVVTFGHDPSSDGLPIDQVAIDGDALQVAAVDGEMLYIYDIQVPDEDPEVVDLSVDGGIGPAQIAIDNGVMLYHDGSVPPRAMLLDIGSGDVTALAANPACSGIALSGGVLSYFLDASAGVSGEVTRAVIGQSAAPEQLIVAVADGFLNEADHDQGAVGFGSTVGVTPDGRYILLAGDGGLGGSEYLQVSTGGAFSIAPDVGGRSDLRLPASDLSVSDSVAAFKTGTSADTVLAYILLPSCANE
jgi:hypothetical protein